MLIYSHDSYGLGHLRRCQTIANHLTACHDDLSVLIISGSPLIGSFTLQPRVDFIRVPGIQKLDNSDYAPISLGIPIQDVMGIRAVTILEVAKRYNPDVFLVDKEPTGLRGEVHDALVHLKAAGARNILGVREVLDDPVRLRDEWARKGALEAVDALYDEIWIYGPRTFYAPLDGLGLGDATHAKAHYTGYLRRSVVGEIDAVAADPDPYILVTPGGGGDGAMMVDWVLRAYERDPGLPFKARIVFGPFLSAEEGNGFRDRVSRLGRVQAINFHANMEAVVRGAVGLVTMGGYNTFCEILSFDKPSLIVPRTRPRLEQYIRAARAEELGLARMLLPSGRPDEDAGRMARALHALPGQPRPSLASVPDVLSGLDRIDDRFALAVAGAPGEPARMVPA